MRMQPSRALPAATRSSGRLDGVIEGVAHDVHQRIDELLDDQLVELGVGAAQLEPHVLVEIAAQPPHHARELLEDLAQRNHAHLEHRRLELPELAVERLVDLGELAADARRAGIRQQPRRSASPSAPRWITSSPTRFISSSSLRMSTRTVSLIDLSDSSSAGSGGGDGGCRCDALRLRRAGRGLGACSAADGAAARPAATARTLASGKSKRASSALGGEVRGHQQREADLRLRASRRERAASRAPRRPREPPRVSSDEPLLEREDLEGRLDQLDVPAAAQVLAQPVLLVLGERTQQRGIDVELANSPRSAAAVALGGLDLGDESAPPARRRLRRPRRRPTLSSRLANSSTAPSSSPSAGASSGHPPEAQAVEDVLEVVGEIADRLEAEHARETLERVRRAEQPIDEVGVDFSAGGALVAEVGEIRAHALEDLLGLGDELPVRLAAGARSGASPRHDRQPCPAPERSRQQVPRDLAQILRVERLHEVRVGAEAHALVAVALRALGGHDDQRDRAVGLRWS